MKVISLLERLLINKSKGIVVLDKSAQDYLYNNFKINVPIKIIPTSMIDISDGLSTEINHLSSASGLSFHIVEDQIPISDNTKSTCEEFKIDTSIASLNGGEDYELLFTTSKKNLKKIQQSDYLSVIGTCVNKKNDNCMITSLGQKININSSGWDSFSVNN